MRNYIAPLVQTFGKECNLTDFGTYAQVVSGRDSVTLDNAGFGTVRHNGVLELLFWLPEGKDLLEVI